MTDQASLPFDDGDLEAADAAIDVDAAVERGDVVVDVTEAVDPADVLDVVAVPDRAAAPVHVDDDEAPREPGPREVEIRSSSRRRRTVTAYREGDRTIVLVPARMSKREQERYAAELVERLDRREARTRRSDTDLLVRAGELSRRWLDDRAQPTAVRWVGNQRSRWGSCTPVDGTIRLSDRMRGMPAYVVDAVLLHELAHLVQPDHGPEFWALVEPFPQHELAKAYLEGAMYGQSHLTDD